MSEALAPVLRQINAAHGTAFALGERFPRGGQGAVRLHDPAGAGFVLKWRPGEPDPGALPAEVPLLDRLRAAGYPIPRYVAWGVLAAPAGRYSVQEQLPGESAWGLRGAALEDALALNDLQAGAGAVLLAFARAAGPPPYEPWRDCSRAWRARAATASASSTRCGTTRRGRRRSWRASRRTPPATPRGSRPGRPGTRCISTSGGRTSWSPTGASRGSWTGGPSPATGPSTWRRCSSTTATTRTSPPRGPASGAAPWSWWTPRPSGSTWRIWCTARPTGPSATTTRRWSSACSGSAPPCSATWTGTSAGRRPRSASSLGPRRPSGRRRKRQSLRG